MAKPKMFAEFKIFTLQGVEVIPVYSGTTKKGIKISFDVDKIHSDSEIDVLVTEIYQIPQIQDVNRVGTKIELYTKPLSNWRDDKIGTQVRKKIQEIYDASSKQALMPQSSTSSQPSASNLEFGVTQEATLKEVQEMSQIEIETIIKRINYGKGKKDDMIRDFIYLGYYIFSDLAKSTIDETKGMIEQKIVGNASNSVNSVDALVIAEELFKYYDEIRSQKSTTQATPTQPSSSTSGLVANGYDIKKMANETASNIINKLGWSNGLKQLMIKDFQDSGYPSFANLVKPTIQETSQEIQKKIQGFPSGRNTYLQANMIAEKLFEEYFQPQASPSQPTATQQPNTGDKIYGIVIKGLHRGELIEILAPSNNGYEEKDYDYKVILNGQERDIPRNIFFVEGDVLSYTYKDVIGNVLKKDEVKVLEITNSEEIKIAELTSMREKTWYVSEINWDSFAIEEYYNLHEIFDSKSTQVVAPQPTAQEKKTLSQDEERVEKLNKEINELIVIKGSLQPFELEDTIKIEQKIDAKQKEINDITVQIVDKKLANNKIFDDLFEQSFLPIQSRYEDIFVMDAPQNSGNFFAPNGAPSKLNDSLNVFIRTPLFKDWFGDWQLAYQYRDIPNSGIYCSKVVSENFEPRVVWHGTGREFSYFRFDNFPAAYFAVNKDYSDFFATIQSPEGEDGYVIPFFLNLRKPLDLTKFTTREVAPKDFFDYIFLETGMTIEFLEVNPIFLDPKTPPVQVWVYLRNNPKMLLKLSESHVYDGIHFYETNPNVPSGQSAHVTEAYIIFKPESCKIADPKRGDIVLASMKSFLLEKGGKI